MNKKRKNSKANYFDDGGFAWQKGAGFGENMKNAFNSGALNSAIGAMGSVAGTAISGGLSSGAGDVLSSLSNVASAIPGPWGAAAGAGLGLFGGLVNKLWGNSINKQAVANFENQNDQQSGLQFSTNNNTDLLNQGNFSLLADINKSDVGKEGVFSNKVTNLTNRLNAERDMANAQAISNYATAVQTVDTRNDLNALSRYAAYGGPLTMRYTGTMSPFGNTFADGGKIFIKPENRGKFTALKERTGKSATWFKEHGTPAQKKMATFALNSKHWSHAFGGNLITNGAEWDNGLTIIGNGGTHEENPREGVQMGMDAQGIPNLVEEGEVIFNDYVFSDRMNVPNSIRSSLGLSKGKNLTFAKAAKKLGKESEERPNDPISKNGLEAAMNRLMQEQEYIRSKDMNNNSNIFAEGGKTTKVDPMNLGYFTPYFGTLAPASYKPSNAQINRYDESLQDIIPEPDLTIKGLPVSTEPNTKLINTINALTPTPTPTPSRPTWLRYAPVAGSLVGLGQSILSKPDYTTPKTIMEAYNRVGNYTPVSAEQLNDYLTYKPYDVERSINKLNAQSSATRRAIIDNSAGNRGLAMANLIAADKNYLDSVGDLGLKSDEFNYNRRAKTAEYNRGTRQYNAEIGLKAAMANQEAKFRAESARAAGIDRAMQLWDNIDARRAAALNANLSGLFENLGNIGVDAYNKQDRDFYLNHVMGSSLPLDEVRRLYGKDAAVAAARSRGYTDEEVNNLFKANGGYLTIKKGGKHG